MQVDRLSDEQVCYSISGPFGPEWGTPISSEKADDVKLTTSACWFYAWCMTNVLSFKFENTDEDTVAVLPCVDGVGLDRLVAAFEEAAGFRDPAGGYGGLIPSFYFFGPLASYFLGQEAPVTGDEQGEIYLLSCECGEVGCWPLIAHVRLHQDKVIWDGFSQPHRRELWPV
ncbi:UNVERIFIED_ORG: hypothetical protein GGE44_004813 [Rhizobium esperanzae]